MGILKYSLLAALVLLALVMMLIGILTVTRGATVQTVIAEGTGKGRRR